MYSGLRVGPPLREPAAPWYLPRLMDIFVVSAEIAPYSRWTSLGETCAALPKALRGLGHKVTVLSPLWASIDPSARHLARRLTKLEIEVGGEKQALVLFDGKSTGGVELQFLANETLFPRNGSATEDSAATAARWGAFARATLQLLKRRESLPDVVHLVGWQAAALGVLLREDPALSSISTVLTIDDARHQGLYERSALEAFGIPSSWWRLDGVEFYGKLSTLKAGIQTAAAITVSSPSYAREILESAGGLEGALRARGKALTGILDGVDVSVWNSATDPWLESRFDAVDVAGKGAYGKHRCKTAAQRDLGFRVRDDVALVGCLGTAADGPGLDSLVEIVPALLRNDVQLVVATEPGCDPARVEALLALAARWPDRLAVRADVDAGAHHRLLGASDLWLVAGLSDPGGARSMQAHRYGALPVALGQGGTADAVVDCDPKLGSGTGFLFETPTGTSMLNALQRALAAHAQKDAFRALQHRAMGVEHSWDRSARLFERVYRGVRSEVAGRAEADGKAASEART